MNQDQFLLKWNNHQNNLVEVFSFLRTQDAFVDVTLACDGKSFPAHKVVLSACSPYFQSLFQSNPCKHPIVFLKDVRAHDMEALIEFIYKGEVSVSQAELASLISTAENLKIKGLAEPEKPSDKLMSAGSCSGKRITSSPPRLGAPVQQLQPALNNSPGLHASPLYFQSAPSAKRKRIEAPSHYSTYAPSYLAAASAGANGSVILREKDAVDLVGKSGPHTAAVVCNNTSSVVVDINSPAAHRLVETVVNSSVGTCGAVAPPSQVVLVQGPVPGEEHIAAGELSYNSSSHPGLSTSDAVLYSVAGTAIYVGRVAGPGPTADGGALTSVRESIKIEPSGNLSADPCSWEPTSNSSNHSYDDPVATPSSTSTATPPTPSSCITSPHHPSPLHHLQHNNHLHTPTSVPSPNPSPLQLAVAASNAADGVVGVAASSEPPPHLTIPGLSLHAADELSEAALHDTAARAATAAFLQVLSDLPFSNHNSFISTLATLNCLKSDYSTLRHVLDTSEHTTSVVSDSGQKELETTCEKPTTPSTHKARAGGRLGGSGGGAVCRVCGSWISRGEHRVHMAAHTADRPLHCAVCGRGFHQTEDLKRHIRIHTGEKPFKCRTCGLAFRQRGHLSRHTFKYHATACAINPTAKG